MIGAQILKDSTSWLGIRLTTLLLTYPRYIHSEFMTHRMLSKNSGSSRAIPVKKVVEGIKENPVFPFWTRNKAGMQGDLVEDGQFKDSLDKDWALAMNRNMNDAIVLSEAGVHKQNANRLLEPFQHIRVVVTGTDWQNFFNLRIHKLAQPEIQGLAKSIFTAMDHEQPDRLEPGEWHLPFIDEEFVTDDSLKVSVARCARTSYNNFDGNTTLEKDRELYERLVGEDPKHLSPTEHQARVPTEKELRFFTSEFHDHKFGTPEWKRGKYVSNLTGWIQLRKLIENNEF